jgi:hypothetical protein
MMAVGLTKIQTQKTCDLENEINHPSSNLSFLLCNLTNHCIRTKLSASFDKGLDYGCIGIEQVVASHSRLAGNASWDDNNTAWQRIMKQ